MADLRWFRLEIDTAGKVVSCVPVERAEQNGRSWVYVQAADAKAAQRAGMNAYMRDVMRVRRAELDRQGKCRWCGRKNDRAQGKRCSICSAKDIAYSQRQRDKAAGKPVPALDRKVAIAERKNEERSQVVAAAAPSLRLAVLIEVQCAWEDAPNNGAFTKWLAEQIDAAGGKRRAANG